MYDGATTLPPLRESDLRRLAPRPGRCAPAQPEQGEHRPDRSVLEPGLPVLSQRPADQPAATQEPDEGPLTFGDVLEPILTRRRLSQAEAGRRCGVGHSHISRLCSGARRPTPALIGDLCAGLELGPVDRFRLYTVAGFVPPDMPPAWLAQGELMAVLREEVRS